MRTPISMLVAALAVAAFATACSTGVSSTPLAPPTAATTPAPAQPQPQPTTETFTGSLSPNGAVTFPFAAQAGTVAATLTSLGSAATLAVGVSLGTWDGTACTVAISNDAAQVNTVVTGTTSVAGNLCVRVYDVGNLTSALPFTISVVHQ